MINVGIVEDDTFIRDELVSILKGSKHFQPILSSESAENFLKYCKVDLNIRFILLDIGLPGMSGIEAIPKIRRKLPNSDILILTSFKDNDTIFKALRVGATGYILKDAGLGQIEETLVNIDKGIPALSPAIARRMIDFFHMKKTKVNKVELSEKESSVLKFLVEGLSYKLIADKMDFSINGVRYYVKNIYKKLHVNSRPELMKLYNDGEIEY
ncbi:MAG: response regulator [Saprospiraceae bacterium]